MPDVIKIEQSWKDALQEEFGKEYWKHLTEYVKQEYEKHAVFPLPVNIFRALDLCPIDEIKVVVLGQDPYHGVGQANGLAFAVNSGVTLPPSLKNIFKEIEADLGYKPLQDGDLSRWAKQGVLLLNSVLTVQQSLPASHKNQGWEIFTDAIIKVLSSKYTNVVFMLWGKYAQNKGQVIDVNNNLVLKSGHPSPFSAQLFHGKHHFSQCNQYLREHNKSEIDWH
jgi:uracil-DNA glycosylase